MSRDISNSDDIIDSREVIARIEELETERTDLQDAIDALRDESGALIIDANDPDSLSDQSELLDTALAALLDWDEENGSELTALRSLAEEGSGSPDWTYGETLIRDSYFETYAQERASDCGMLKDDDKWPYTCIDWDKACRELQYDYSQVDFDGVTYWIRS